MESKAAGVVCAGLQEKWQDAQFAARLPGATNEAALGLAEGAAHLRMCASNQNVLRIEMHTSLQWHRPSTDRRIEMSQNKHATETVQVRVLQGL